MRIVHIETQVVTRFAVVNGDDDVEDIKECSTVIKKFKKSEFDRVFGELEEGKAKILKDASPTEGDNE